MSVLIKGMEMPKSCWNCPCSSYYDRTYQVLCDLTEKRLDDKPWRSGRDSDCPLVEIPTPHGRLGDLDALYEEISNGNKAYNGIEGYDGKYPNIANVDDCLDAIKYADTVIEAEGSET